MGEPASTDPGVPLWEGRCETFLPRSAWLIAVLCLLVGAVFSRGVLVYTAAPYFHTALYVSIVLWYLWFLASWRSQSYRISARQIVRTWGVLRTHEDVFERTSEDRILVSRNELYVFRRGPEGHRHSLLLSGLSRADLVAGILRDSGQVDAAALASEDRDELFARPLIGPLYTWRDLVRVVILAGAAGCSYALTMMLLDGRWLGPRFQLLPAVVVLPAAAILLDHLVSVQPRERLHRLWLASLEPVCLLWPARNLSPTPQRGLLGLTRDSLVFVPTRGTWPPSRGLKPTAKLVIPLAAVSDLPGRAGPWEIASGPRFELARPAEAALAFSTRLAELRASA